MKYFTLTLVAMGMLEVGCALARPQIVEGVVGPAPLIQPDVREADRGTLLVFSAFETNSLGASPFDDIHPHTDYSVYASNGTLLEKVSNREAGLNEGPTAVKLAPGLYHVVALCSGHGVVRVAVEIQKQRVTAVHLDGDTAQISRQSKVVRLATGETVGWSAAQ